MKKLVPYVIGIAAVGLLLVVLLASKGKPVRRMDERITLRMRDKIPYGTAVAYHLLPSLFPDSKLFEDNRYPGTWEGISIDEGSQAAILVADYFNAEDDELEYLNRFVKNGNSVFIIARSFSDQTAAFFKANFNSFYNFNTGAEGEDMQVKLEKTVFPTDSLYTYPGMKYEGRLMSMDTATTAILGNSISGQPNFIQFSKGNGRFYIHTAPLAFSNYFILHKQNAAYYRHALSVIPKDVRAIVWNEYYLDKIDKPSDKDEVNWLGTLLQYPAFKWGLLTAMGTLLLYVLLGMRRKQRMIPPHGKPKNDSLDFVKTLGRLYYDRGDHKNLAEKMGAYFLEHVRSTYKIPTHTLDNEFVQTLHAKSGFPESELRQIISTIDHVPGMAWINEETLAEFHLQLEHFYQTT